MAFLERRPITLRDKAEGDPQWRVGGRKRDTFP